jgi:hypothetical protein
VIARRRGDSLWPQKSGASMAYSIITLRGALKDMAVASTAKPWVWQANTAAVNPKLQQQFPYGRDSIRSILVMDPKLKTEIHGFDKSRLRPPQRP